MRICDFCKCPDRVAQCYISLGRKSIWNYNHLDDKEKVIADLHSDHDVIRPELCVSCRSEVAKRLSTLMHEVRNGIGHLSASPEGDEVK